MVEHAPRFEDIYPQLQTFLTDCVLVAHNAEFDVGFLKAEASGITYQ